LALTLLTGTFFTSIHAATIFEAPNKLGDLARESQSNWSSGTGAFGGVEDTLTKEDCRSSLIKYFKAEEPNKFHFMAKYTREFELKHIQDEDIQNIENYKKDSLIGMGTSYYGVPGGGYSPEKAVHIKVNCAEFTKISTSQVTISKENKTCRETRIEMDELYYDVHFCEGEDSGYVSFPNEMDLEPENPIIDFLIFWD
jgi:hypothetical protein